MFITGRSCAILPVTTSERDPSPVAYSVQKYVHYLLTTAIVDSLTRIDDQLSTRTSELSTDQARLLIEIRKDLLAELKSRQLHLDIG